VIELLQHTAAPRKVAEKRIFVAALNLAGALTDDDARTVPAGRGPVLQSDINKNAVPGGEPRRGKEREIELSGGLARGRGGWPSPAR
jgi:hypothetical protein